MILPCALFLLGINLATVAAFGIDKRRALNGQWRIAESTLIGLALVGGTPGALWARRRYRHKTRKQPFTAILQAIAVLHAAAAVGLAAGLAPAMA